MERAAAWSNIGIFNSITASRHVDGVSRRDTAGINGCSDSSAGNTDVCLAILSLQ